MVAWDVADDPMLAGDALLAWMFPAERLVVAARAIRC